MGSSLCSKCGDCWGFSVSLQYRELSVAMTGVDTVVTILDFRIH